jgi:hypothetical protein
MAPRPILPETIIVDVSQTPNFPHRNPPNTRKADQTESGTKHVRMDKPREFVDAQQEKR